MKECTTCKVNSWSWKCEQGMMQGTCLGCGAKTNKFKANGSHRKAIDKKL
jgi:hypothetical protein